MSDMARLYEHNRAIKGMKTVEEESYSEIGVNNIVQSEVQRDVEMAIDEREKERERERERESEREREKVKQAVHPLNFKARKKRMALPVSAEDRRR